MNYDVDEQPMLALRRARRAWEASQPQLFLDFGALNEGEVKRAAGEPSPTSPVAAAASPSLSAPNPGGQTALRSSRGRRAHRDLLTGRHRDR